MQPAVNQSFCHAPCSATLPVVHGQLQVGYMGVPYEGGDMTAHRQYVVVRNERGQVRGAPCFC